MKQLIEGHEYTVVKQYASDEWYGYREMDHGHIETITVCGEQSHTAFFHVPAIQQILAHREYGAEVEAQEQTRLLHHEHNVEAERRFSA